MGGSVETQQNPESEKSPEIQIDFGKIKNFFKREKKEVKESQEQVKNDTEISFDAKKVWTWIVQHKTWFLILIPIILSIYLRSMPLYLPATDDWAANAVHTNIRNQIASQISQSYPNLPDAQRNELVERDFQQVLSEKKTEIDQQIQATSQYFKSQFQDESGQTYLLEIDPFLWMGMARNYLKYGRSGAIEKDGVVYHGLRGGRFSPPEGFNPISYTEAKLYQVMSFFKKDISLMFVAFILPIIIMALAVIPAYLIGKQIAGDFAGILSGVIVASHGALLYRTMGGFSDNDPFSALFPLLIVYGTLKALDASTMKKGMLWALFAALMTVLYDVFWSGFWFIFLFVLLTLGAYILYQAAIQVRKERKISWTIVKKSTCTLALFYFGAAILNGLIYGVLIKKEGFMYEAIRMLQTPILTGWFVQLKQVAITSIWPNVLTTVAELNPTSMDQIIGTVGGKVFFLLGMMACIFAVSKGQEYKKDWPWYAGSALWYLFLLSWNPEKITFLILLGVPMGLFMLKSLYVKEERPFHYSLIILIWFVGTIYASTTSIRFIALLAPIFGIAFGVSASRIAELLATWFKESFSVKTTYTWSIVAILFCLMLLNPVKVAIASAGQQVPLINDAWKESLDVIKNDDTDGIITSWWDFGHWFVTLGERKVTFDGGDQGQRIHWVGKLLLSDNDEEVVSILKMLNCGQEFASRKLSEYNKKGEVDSVHLLYNFSNKDRAEAEALLEERGLTQTQVEEIMNLTHCEYLPQYLIMSSDMTQKAGVWAHFGSWDFDRAEIFNAVKRKNFQDGVQLLKEKYNYPDQQATALYNQIQTQDGDSFIAPWPSFASNLAGCNLNGELLLCGNGAIVNTTSSEAFVSATQGILKAASLVYADGTGIHEIVAEDPQTELSVMTIPTNNRFNAIMAARPLAKSLFSRLFFYNGHGTQHFKLLSEKTSVLGEKIQVWKVTWESQEPLMIYEQKPVANVTGI
ncbi:hypothetical protein J4457_01220 [Candidatus Woesearchaeota archaeon]|nr:hypothetical protein [Candidatus Woesearchaeota archaeon]